MVRLSHSRMSLRILVVVGPMLAASILAVPASSGAQQEQLTADQVEARAKLNEGVQAFRNGKLEEATQDFKRATELDPSLTNAHLYLATAYASQYIPGAPSDENLNLGKQAIQEFKTVLDRDPKNLTAMDGIGSILYNMGANPFDAAKLAESKTYHLKHIEIKAADPEPYFWIGVIDWSIAYHAEQQKRSDWTQRTGQALAPDQVLPELARDEFGNEYGDTIDEGIGRVKKALEFKPDYDDAMAYLNLLYRLKADTENSPQARDEDIKTADELVDKLKEIRQARAASQQQKN
jgi:tetratricopeptide (TPR) repeat protein